MSSELSGAEQLRPTPGGERMAGPAMGSFAIHGLLAATIVCWGMVNGLFRHNTWGGTQGGGTVQVNLTSTIPLPSVKVNDNVLQTDTPSAAPAAPAPKAQQRVDDTAIPISGKQAKPKPVTTPKTQQHQPQPIDNRAQYGDRSGSIIQRATSPSSANGPTAVADSDFGSRFPWYVDGITRKLLLTLNRGEVDSHTARGAHANLIFTIHRDGSPAEVQLSQSSGSATLDRACLHAVQRVDTFGQLPAGYNQSTLKATYDCVY